jgi:hypothetical protein
VFTDQLGRVVLQRKVADNQQFDTYTVYADAGYVQAIIPPAAVRAMEQSGEWNILDTEFQEPVALPVHLRRPGPGSGAHVSGRGPGVPRVRCFDRPILIQDGNRRAAASKQWMFTKFDAQNRTVAEGLWADSRSRADLQTAADAFARTQTMEYETRTASGYTTGNTFPPMEDGVGGAALLTLSFYDDYDLDGNGQADYQLKAR